MFNGVMTGKDGALYAAAFFEIIADTYPTGFTTVSGVLRSINPTADEPDVEVVSDGLQKASVSLTSDREVVLDTLSLVPGSNNLLSLNSVIDLSGPEIIKIVSRPVVYKDTLSDAKLALTAPAANAVGVGTVVGVAPETVTATISWTKVDGATKYEYQICRDPGFGDEDIVKSGITSTASNTLTGLDPNSVYYWRVRVARDEPVLSPWSETRKFTTALGLTVRVPQLLAPAAGATGVSTKPVFTWQPLAGAATYELVVSKNADMSSPVISQTVNNTSFLATTALENNTTYFWRVRGKIGDNISDWSGVWGFTTAPAPPPTTTPPPPTPVTVPPTPAWVLVVIAIGALLVIAIIVLIVRTRRV